MLTSTMGKKIISQYQLFKTLCALLLIVISTSVNANTDNHSLSAELNLIEKIRFPKKNRMEVVINRDFKNNYLKDDFFVEYDEDVDLTKLDDTIVILPFIMNVISLVWVSGKDYYIDAMDQEVCDSLERLKKLFQFLYPRTEWNGRLIPRKKVAQKKQRLCDEKTSKQSCKPETIAILFSGGIDSLTCSYKNRSKKQVLITAWGQSCLPLDNVELWSRIKERITDFASLYGFENAFIRSNYYYFLNFKKLSKLSPEIVTWRIQTIEDIGWAGLTAPILLSRGISTLHIGSSDSMYRFYPTACNPYIDGNIRFAGLTFKHDQFELTRHDKISYIVNLCRKQKIQKPELIVCQKRGGIINCGICEKCCATLLSFLALGEDPCSYGYTRATEEAIEASRNHLNNLTVNSVLVWQCEDIKKSEKALKNELCDLSWLHDIDTSKFQPYDLKKSANVNVKKLQQLFPDISY